MSRQLWTADNPRQHGRTRYVLGGFVGDKPCRCDVCRAATADYERRRKQAPEPAYVGATRAREHVAWLATQDVGLKTVAKVSGVAQGALWKLMYGKRMPDGSQRPSKRIRPETEAKILAVTPRDGADGSRVPAGPVWEDVRTLLGRGWTKRAIAHAIGNGNENGLQLGEEVVTRRNAHAIRALLDEPVPETVGAAWSAHHKIADDLADEDDRRDLARRHDAADRQRRYRMGDDYEPAPFDDHDRLLLSLVEMLEARIDENEWRKRSACRGRSAWMFFPARGDHRTIAAAKKVCESCPVREQCLAANLDERDGIFGGMTGRERRDLRREQAA